MTAGPLLWMGDALAAAGLKVTPYAGWQERGHPGTFHPEFVVLHHDASPAGSSPGALDWVANGDSSLPGPCANLWVDYTGGWHLVASGKAYHAGTGGPYANVPKDQLNSYSIGIEIDHTVNEPWQSVQLDSVRKGCAALLNHLSVPTDPNLLFHKTWAPGRKIDPWGLDLATERRIVQLMRLGITPNNPTPAPPAPTLEDGTMLLRTRDGYVYAMHGTLAVHVLSPKDLAPYTKAGYEPVALTANQEAEYVRAGIKFPK